MSIRKAGFTLIELLVALTILAVLAGLLLPAITMVREQANRVKCLSRLRQWGMTITGYADDNHGFLPSSVYQSKNLGVNFEPYHIWLQPRTEAHKKDEINLATLANYMPDTGETQGSRTTLHRSWVCPKWDDRTSSAGWHTADYAGSYVEFGGYMYFAGKGRSNRSAVRDHAGIPDREPGSSQELLMADVVLTYNWNGLRSFASHRASGRGYDKTRILGQHQLYADGHVIWRKFSQQDSDNIHAKANADTPFVDGGFSYYYY
ncbi:MAG: type II secretion system protein [Planctomycetota bacterium]|jgi:prepilin-type N-terminal cleavage/methylation domain-containing protein|nr:type II secretion system protein [Planctomycetota bacterium]